MKNIANMMIVLILGVISIVSMLTVAGRSDRDMELENNLPSAVEETVNALFVNRKYNLDNRKEFIADFIEELTVRFDQDCDIVVNIMKADLEKGILSVRIVAEYEHPNGEPGKVTCDRTVIFDKVPEDEPEIYTVKFITGHSGNEECYKSFQVYAGETVPVPAVPQLGAGTFSGWADANGYLADFSQPVEQDVFYYASHI